MYHRKMALDLGDVRIGIALSDLTGMIASGLETYTRRNESRDIAHIIEIAKQKSVDTIVIGLPINMDGTHGPRAQKTKEFAQLLSEHTDAKIVFWDERLTSYEAERILIEAGMRRQNRRQVIDKLAATIILQEYLNSK